jgi:hypothetical protein
VATGLKGDDATLRAKVLKDLVAKRQRRSYGQAAKSPAPSISGMQAALAGQGRSFGPRPAVSMQDALAQQTQRRFAR